MDKLLLLRQGHSNGTQTTLEVPVVSHGTQQHYRWVPWAAVARLTGQLDQQKCNAETLSRAIGPRLQEAAASPVGAVSHEAAQIAVRIRIIVCTVRQTAFEYAQAHCNVKASRLPVLSHSDPRAISLSLEHKRSVPHSAATARPPTL
jgi:hypothetical protein